MVAQKNNWNGLKIATKSISTCHKGLVLASQILPNSSLNSQLSSLIICGLAV